MSNHWLTQKQYENFQRNIIGNYKEKLICQRGHAGRITNNARCQLKGKIYRNREAMTTNFMGSYESNYKGGGVCCRAKSPANVILAQCFCLDQNLFKRIRQETNNKIYSEADLIALPKSLAIEIKRLSLSQLHDIEFSKYSFINDDTNSNQQLERAMVASESQMQDYTVKKRSASVISHSSGSSVQGSNRESHQYSGTVHMLDSSIQRQSRSLSDVQSNDFYHQHHETTNFKDANMESVDLINDQSSQASNKSYQSLLREFQVLKGENDKLIMENNSLTSEIRKMKSSTDEKFNTLLGQFNLMANKIVSLENKVNQQTVNVDTTNAGNVQNDKTDQTTVLNKNKPLAQTENIRKQYPLYKPLGNNFKSFSEALKSSTSSFQNKDKSLRVTNALTKLVKINSVTPRSTYANQRKVSVKTSVNNQPNFLVPYYLGGIKPDKLKTIKEALKELGFFGVKIKNISFIANSVCELLVDMDYAAKCERLLLKYNKILQWLPTFEATNPLKGSKVTTEKVNSSLADRLAKIIINLENNNSSSDDDKPWNKAIMRQLLFT